AHDLAYGAVHFDHLAGRAPCPLVQAVNILCNQRMQFPAPFERHERAMSGIWFRMPGGVIDAALPGEFADLGIRQVAMNIREPFSLGVLCPNALRTAEVGNAGFSRDTSAGQ